MGKPVKPSILDQISLSAIVDSTLEDCTIVKQTGVNRYVAKNSSNKTATVVLQNSTPSAVGQAQLLAAPYPGSSYTPAKANVAIGLRTISLNSAGAGYRVGDIVNVRLYATGVIDAQIRITGVSSIGGVVSMSISNPGRYYNYNNSNSSTEIIPTDGGLYTSGGSGYHLLINVTSFKIVAFEISSRGSDYQKPPIVSLVGSAYDKIGEATAVLTNGSVSSINITDAGNYKSSFPPTVEFTIIPYDPVRVLQQHIIKMYADTVYEHIIGPDIALEPGQAQIPRAS